MRCQARRGRRRGGVLSQAQIPGPLQRSPSGRGGGSDGGHPDAGRLKPPIGRTCLRGTQTRRQCCREHPGSGANKTAGMRAEVANDRSPIPRARVPVGLVHHPAGTSRATGQAEAPSHDDAAAGPAPGRRWNSRFNARRRLARETHAAGIDAERGAGRSHIHTYTGCFWRLVRDKFQPTRREQSRPESELGQVITPHPEVPDLVGPRRARPPAQDASRPALLAGTSA